MSKQKAPIGSRSKGFLMLWSIFFDALVRLLTVRNLRHDRFGTLAAILGVALGTATVNTVLVLDTNTREIESVSWTSNPDMPVSMDTVQLQGVHPDGTPTQAKTLARETHEDYEVMRSAIRLGSLSAFLVGALIVFFTFGVVVERRKREVALLRSLGAQPYQVAAIFVRESILIGLAGALLGLLFAVPLTYLAARAGLTTTGRATISIYHLWFPWKRMAVISMIGAASAVLGVIRPARDVLRLDVGKTLRPQFLEASSKKPLSTRGRGITLISLPFMTLVYILLRPFFKNALPSLTFFVLEAGLVCAAFLATLVLVPELVRRLGSLMIRLLPKRPSVQGLLTRRRIEHVGQELSWSVSGIMLVFALLLSLHISTYALRQEVDVWAKGAVEPYAYLVPTRPEAMADSLTKDLPAPFIQAKFSGLTLWPTRVRAVSASDLILLAKASGRQDLVQLAEQFGPGKILLSKMMARRYHVSKGDYIELENPKGKTRLLVLGVTDDLGYTPIVGPYRHSKTYGIIDASDYPLIAAMAPPIGSYVVFADPTHPGQTPDWSRLPASYRKDRHLRLISGEVFRKARIQGTERDFVIFDFILVLTSVLAAVGIANQMVLSVHARRREIGLYRVLGMTTTQVRYLILMEGGLIGLLGGALAALLGVPLGYASIGALRSVSAFEVEFELPWTYVVLTVLGALILALGASLHPARRASSVDSAEAIHYE